MSEVIRGRQKYSLLKLFFYVRLVNSLLTTTFFQADEFWQALEPAHYMAFGYGHLTWEWKEGLRSYAFPFIFEITYRLANYFTEITTFCFKMICFAISEFIKLGYFNESFTFSALSALEKFPAKWKIAIEYPGILYGPKITMALIAATGEFFTIIFIQKIYKLSVKKEDDKIDNRLFDVTKVSVILSITNMFNVFFATRTFINSFEMTLTAIALYYWDWSMGNEIGTFNFFKGLTVAMFACWQRASNGLIWITLGGWLLFWLLINEKYFKIFQVLLQAVGAFLVSGVINTAIDFYFYGDFVFPLLKFLKFNFQTPLSKFYGIAQWHFHFSQSLPIILGYSIPYFLFGLFITNKMIKRYGSCISNPFNQLRTVLLVNILVFSSLAHKEFRFLFPLQPIFLLFSTYGVLKVDRMKRHLGSSTLIWILGFFSLLVGSYLCVFHESGTIEVIKFLHNEPSIKSLGFIMPCHSTPGQSLLHRDDIQDLWSISCEPPLHLLNDPKADQKLASYMDESDHLYDNIPDFFYKHFPPIFNDKLRTPGKNYTHEWPQFLVVFEHLDDAYLREFLSKSNYVEYTRFFNTFSHWDSRRSGDVIIYEKIR